MALPLRKDRDEQEERTTADLAQAGKAPEDTGARPVASEPASSETNSDRVIEMKRSEPQNQDATRLFPNTELENLRTRWKEIRTNFVDEPRKAV